MGGNFSAVATLLLKEVRSADRCASTPPAVVTAASTPDPALANATALTIPAPLTAAPPMPLAAAPGRAAL